MDNIKLLRTGLIGSIIVALCCFTPVLVILLGVVGLSALTGYLDYVLFPALILFLGIAGYAAFRKHQSQQNTTCCNTDHEDGGANDEKR
ncbi:MAG: mercury resistance system transport protein MerF [Methyloprofundus sp.]|nr:mercury resistance system transport protein MerF [Methyloprofundus sp.]